MPQFLAPICNDQLIDVNGDPLVGGQIETYLAGSTTPAQTYTDDSGSVPQSNPIILNSLGYAPNPIWLTGGVSYKFVIKNAAGVIQRTVDDVAGVNDASVSQSEWVDSGLVPTYINPTSFSVPGDQTTVLQVGRRVRSTNTSGLIYSTISSSVFAAGITTVTLTNDSTTLDPGLSAVAYGLLAASPLSVPDIPPSKLIGTVPVSKGGTGQANAAAAFAALKQDATETVTGVVELATTAEAQAGTDTARALTPARLKDAQIQRGTAVTLTTQTAVDFTGIPSWANRVTMMFAGVSTNGTANWLIQLGDSGGVEATGYLGSASSQDAAVSTANFTTGFGIRSGQAVNVAHGVVTIERQSGNTWVASGALATSNIAAIFLTAGSKSLSDVLDRVRLTTTNGTDQFDAGTVNISWE